jgi:hypothetical protein
MDDLITLIGALSPSEKQHFKKKAYSKFRFCIVIRLC